MKTLMSFLFLTSVACLVGSCSDNSFSTWPGEAAELVKDTLQFEAAPSSTPAYPVKVDCDAEAEKITKKCCTKCGEPNCKFKDMAGLTCLAECVKAQRVPSECK